MPIMEVIIRAIDEASHVVEGIAQKTGQAGGFIEKNWVAIGAGAAVAGGAMEAVARQQAPLTEQTRRLGAALNLSTEEVRTMAGSLSDVGFPLADVLSLMEIGRQQGIESAAALKDYAAFWDMVGDATGASGPQLAAASSSLQTLGIDAGQEGQALAAFGFIAQETTSGVAEFMRIIERVGPEMSSMGMNIDDAAAVLGILEREMGLTGRVARQELQQAITDANGDMTKMLEILGVSGEQFDTYRGKVAAASDVIARNAEINDRSFTVMQKAQHWAAELTYQYGDMIGVLTSLTPVMMALGPIIKGVSLAKTGLAKVSIAKVIPALAGATKGAIAFGIAMLANPITWIILGIVALVAAIVLIWKNWDQVSAWLVKSWEWIKEKAAAIWNGITEFFAGFWESLKTAFSAALQFIVDLFLKYSPLGFIISNWEQIAAFFAGIWGRIRGTFSGALQGMIDRIRTWVGNILSSAQTAGRNLLEGFMGAIRDLPEQLWTILTGAVSRLINIGGQLWTAARNAGSRIWSGIKNGLGMQSPGYIERAIDDIAARAARLPDEMKSSFASIPGLNAIPNGIPAFAGQAYRGQNQIVEHRHSGTLRVTIDGPGGTDYRKIVDVVMNEIRREVRG